MSRIRRKWLIIAGSLLMVVVVLFLFRYPILRGMGNYLIYEDSPQPVAVVFVLGGNAYDRGMEAARLYKEGIADQFVCTSKMVPIDFQVLGIDSAESYLTKIQMVKHGVPEEKVTVLEQGTSTKEESEIALAYCLENGLQTAMVLSTKFHTRRIKYFFGDKFEEAGIQLLIHGAAYSHYDHKTWWDNEYGLLDVNNEYMKLAYYLIN